MNTEVTSANRAYQVFKQLGFLEVEEVWTLALGPNLRILASEMIFRGTVASCPIHAREIFRFAISRNASNVIIAHNHPSQETRPSVSDIEATKQLIFTGKLIEIPVVDHLIITRTGFTSFRENAWCEF